MTTRKQEFQLLRLTLRSIVGNLNKACCWSSCNIFISDVDDRELVGLELTVIGLLLIEWQIEAWPAGRNVQLPLFWMAVAASTSFPVALPLLLLFIKLLLKWLFKLELFIIELEFWSVFAGLLCCALLLLIDIRSLCGFFVNTGEFGAEWCIYAAVDEAPPDVSMDDEPPFDGVRSLSFNFRSLYAVFTPRPPCFTYKKKHQFSL